MAPSPWQRRESPWKIYDTALIEASIDPGQTQKYMFTVHTAQVWTETHFHSRVEKLSSLSSTHTPE